MTILIAIILGIVEGLTEFLPVSSTGHLIIVGDLLHFTGERAASFEVFIQLGAILAVVWLYRERFWMLFELSKPTGSDPSNGLQGKRGLTLLALTTLPALVAGLALHSFIKDYLFQPVTVAAGLFVGGIALIVFERYYKRIPVTKQPKTLSLDSLTARQALSVGLFQILALWPGVSRSASTIVGGMMGGIDRKTAVEYSFLAAVPVMVAATGYDLLSSLSSLQSSDIPLFMTGFITAFIAALLAITFFVKLVQRYNFTPFGWYRIGLAILVLVLFV